MNKTEKYQLNQWELTDRIQMEDFNSDNAKIDAALAEQAAALDTKASKAELAAEQTARINAVKAEKAAREAADAAQLSTLRSENMWVKLGEVTLTQAGPQMSITVANVERYARIWGQYTLRGPKVVSCSLGTVFSLDLLELEAYNSTLSIGTMDIICCGSTAYFCTESHTNDGQHTWGHSDSSLRANSGLSGSTEFKVFTEDADLAAGAYMVLYGLKK